MPRLKLATLCLLVAAGTLVLAAAPQEAVAEGICSQLKKQGKRVPAKGCVNATDVRKNSLTHEDMKNEAGANFVKGKSFHRSPPRRNTVYATINVVAPASGHIVVTAYVGLGTLTPQRQGGALECRIVLVRSPGFNVPSRGPKVSGSVIRGVKNIETMLWTETIPVSNGLSRFTLVCKRIDTQDTDFGANSFITAEYYPKLY